MNSSSNQPLHEILPSELLLHIFFFFDITTLCSLRFVCKFWKKQSDNSVLWKLLTLKTFGSISEPVDDWRQKYIELFKQLQFSKMFVSFDELNFNALNFHAKVVIVGDPKVGKTHFISAYLNKEFKESEQPLINEHKFQVTVNDIDVSFTLWDTMGQSDYDK